MDVKLENTILREMLATAIAVATTMTARRFGVAEAEIDKTIRRSIAGAFAERYPARSTADAERALDLVAERVSDGFRRLADDPMHPGATV